MPATVAAPSRSAIPGRPARHRDRTGVQAFLPLQSRSKGWRTKTFATSLGLCDRQLGDRSQRPPEVLRAERLGAADCDARQRAAIALMPVEESCLPLGGNDVGNQAAEGSQACPQAWQQPGRAAAA